MERVDGESRRAASGKKPEPEQEQEEMTAEANAPMPDQGMLLPRERLNKRLAAAGRDVGCSVICAPDGFGKTALLIQYTASVLNDPARGAARLIDAGGMDAQELGRALQTCGEELDASLGPLVAIDNMPAFKAEIAQQIVVLLRALQQGGFEVVVACRPDNAAFILAFKGASTISARMLLVQPREYSDWARAFSISSALDVYELTQGVPALVVQLRNMTSAKTGGESLDRATANLYRQAMEPLRSAHDPLYRLACYFILMGRGSLADFERAGMRIRKDLLERLARDYPMFGYNAENQTFSCMATQGEGLARLRKEIASKRSTFAMQVMRMLMHANRVDDAVRLAGELLDTSASLEIIAQFPTQFALSGNALFVHGIASRLNGEEMIGAPVGVVLAVYLAALTMGEYRLARAMCAALRRRANEIEGAVDAETWACARAFSEVWEGCNGVELPQLSKEYERPTLASEVVLLQSHRSAYHELVEAGGNPSPALYAGVEDGKSENEVDVARLLLLCDRTLDDALHRAEADASARSGRLEQLTEVLEARHLAPLLARVRMVAATQRLLLGEPLADERAFTDAGTTAVRESDFGTQLFCFLGEGWQAVATNQVVNAQFRAQQVLKLASDEQVFLRAWAVLLDRAAYVLGTSQVGIRSEAELLDLSDEAPEPADAWAVALHLSAARFDSELSAWYSLHKDVLLDARFCPMARLAMHAVGPRADSMRRLLPRSAASRYLLGDELDQGGQQLFCVPGELGFSSMGQVNIRMFGGFWVERNGHVLTDEVWRRKKASVLAARLALSLGSFVGRRTITEELWPQADYIHARESLYVTLSTLRSAFGQQDEGPQYVVSQGEGLALNAEFVAADTASFDLLAREILLKRAGVSSRQIIESCLKMEQLYVGPLYVPDTGDAVFFLRMRQIYLSRFVDCMLRGVDLALDADDLHSALWFVESALRQAPTREDVVRSAMRVYDLAGRRREVVELYNSHSYYLEHELQSLPDDETRKVYEGIIQRSRLVAMM